MGFWGYFTLWLMIMLITFILYNLYIITVHTFIFIFGTATKFHIYLYLMQMFNWSLTSDWLFFCLP